MLTFQVDHPRGSIANPMTEAEMNRKVHMLGDPVVGAEAIDALVALVDGIEALPRIDRLLQTTVPGRAAA